MLNPRLVLLSLFLCYAAIAALDYGCTSVTIAQPGREPLRVVMCK